VDWVLLLWSSSTSSANQLLPICYFSNYVTLLVCSHWQLRENIYSETQLIQNRWYILRFETACFGLYWPSSGFYNPLGAVYTGCPRRNVRDFGRVFLIVNYTDITQNTYIQIWTVTEIMAVEMCGLLGCPRTVRRPWRHTRPMRVPGNVTW